MPAKHEHGASRSGPGRLKVVGATLALAAAVPMLSGCHPPSPPVGLSTCYESLPLAEGVLNLPKAEYTFKGVKLVSPRTMEHLVKERFPRMVPASLHLPAKAQACAFAFTGNFTAGEVAGAPARAKGKAAIVLTTTDRKLLFSFVLSGLPEKFSRTFSQV
jgi:hypothetical protein